MITFHLDDDIHRSFGKTNIFTKKLYMSNFYYCLLPYKLVLGFCDTGNFLVSKEPPHRPILLDFGLTKKLSNPFKQALAKMFLASAEVCAQH